MRYWSPKLRPVRPGEWIQFDGSRRIAVITEIELSSPSRKLLRAVTWAEDPLARDLIGFFPAGELRLAAEIVWRQVGPPETPEHPPAPSVADGQVGWHPLLNAEERRPGTWTMVDSVGYAYGSVHITRQGDDVYYLGQFRQNPIGRFERLRPAVENIHLAYIRSTHVR